MPELACLQMKLIIFFYDIPLHEPPLEAKSSPVSRIPIWRAQCFVVFLSRGRSVLLLEYGGGGGIMDSPSIQ